MAKVSFLIGSGFSVPAGYPTTTELNQKLQRIDASEICIHTSRQAWFLDGQTDPNASWMGLEERQFVQQFLEFYNTRVLGPGEVFNYETFYDYYNTAYKTKTYSAEFVDFLTNFRTQHSNAPDIDKLLWDFNDNFSQFLAGLLKKPLECSHRCKPYGSEYNAFLLIVEELAKKATIHFHSLNHDVLLENLAISDCMQGHLGDGFEELGSPIYAKQFGKYATFMVRLARFTNTFNEPFCLYKLHGSIDYYWCSFEGGSTLVKIPLVFSTQFLHKEREQNGKIEYLNGSADVVPNFLSGTTNKLGRYDQGTYYPLVHGYFRKNLRESKSLIVIGYGFRDIGINKYLEDNFLVDANKAMFVVDIERPENDYLDRPNVHFVEGGVSGMNIKLILKDILL